MIHYSETFERWTDEDAEIGDTDDRGFEREETADTFADMINILAFAEPSQLPVPDQPDKSIWFTVYDYGNGAREYYEDGVTEHRSYHPKTDRDARYMLKAWKQRN